MIGMLWFDNDKDRTLEEKVDRAAQYYADKYKAAPNLCYVHPKTFPGGERVVIGKVEIRSTPTVLPNHFWLGVDGD